MAIFNHESNKKITNEIIEKYLKGNKKIIDHYNALINETRIIYKKYHIDTLRDLDNKKLIKLIKFLFETMHIGQTVTLFCEVLDEEIIKKHYYKLNNKSKANVNEFLDHINIQCFIPFVHKFNKILINSKNHYNIQWIFCNYICASHINDVPNLIENHFKKRGGKDKILKEYRNCLNSIGFKKNKVEKFKKTLSKELLDLFEIARFAIRIRDERKEFFFRLITLLSNSVRELFKRINIPEENIPYTFYADFKMGIYKTQIYKKILEKRKKGFIIYFNQKGVRYDYKDYKELKDILYKIKDNNIPQIEKTILGTPACQGYAKGTAKIILNESDFPRFKQGNILITSMTLPEFVPIMGKAGAIITDEGGITCHAAIISREMNILCIVGTDNATRKIKEGDIVYVDANRGKVKILKRANV